MIPIHVHTNLEVKEVVDLMLKVSFRPLIILNMREHKQPKTLSIIELPSDDVLGIIITKRRRVFLFWKMEYLIVQRTPLGDFYSWYKESQVVKQ